MEKTIQKVERINFKNSVGLNIVGDLYKADSKSIVLLLHGFTGDRHEWGKFDKVAERINKAGYNVLAIDFSGSGESDDASLTVDKEVDDLKCAINYVKYKGLKRIALVGLSLGGLVSLKSFSNDVSTLVLYAPVTDQKPNYRNRFTEKQQEELDKKGYITYPRNRGFRKIIVIDKQMIIDRESVNQADLLSKINIPVLIIHGTNDKRVPLRNSESAIKLLPKGSKLELIEGDEHFDEDHYTKYIDLTIDWLKSNLNELTFNSICPS